MEYYDVIIIGAGIAGCGLAYNLKRFGYQGSVLIIDKKEVGARAGHNTRTVFQETIDEYKIPNHHRYKGIKVGFNEKTFITIKTNLTHISYKETCSYLLKNSGMPLINEEAKETKGNILITNGNNYSFKYLIDSTGADFFLRKKLNKQLPSRYWVGALTITENKNKMSTDYVYYNYSDDYGYVEELNPLPNQISQGYWKYTDKRNFSKLRIPENTLYKKFLSNEKIIKKRTGLIVGAIATPLVCKNYVFLGDSFGNASNSTAYGIAPILDSSKLLSYAIIKNNISLYEKSWNKKYKDTYIKYITFKTITQKVNNISQRLGNHSSFSHFLKKYLIYDRGKDFINVLKDATHLINIPKEMRKNSSKSKVLTQLIYYVYLKLKYS